MEDYSGGHFRRKTNNFSIVSNSVIRDDQISLKAKGLYVLIQSYITMENFTLYKSFLKSKCSEGVRAFDSAWKELKEAGYLKQYKMRQGGKTFYYEYELLDEPETIIKPNNFDAHQSHIQNVCTKDVHRQKENVQRYGDINNTILNNTINNNTYPIISSEAVREMIRYDTFAVEDRGWLDEIVLLVAEVMNMKDENTIRIARNTIPALNVKERFRELNMFHIQYVLFSLKQNETEISNVKNYLLTALYNAPTTMNTYYRNQLNI